MVPGARSRVQGALTSARAARNSTVDPDLGGRSSLYPLATAPATARHGLPSVDFEELAMQDGPSRAPGSFLSALGLPSRRRAPARDRLRGPRRPATGQPRERRHRRRGRRELGPRAHHGERALRRLRVGREEPERRRPGRRPGRVPARPGDGRDHPRQPGRRSDRARRGRRLRRPSSPRTGGTWSSSPTPTTSAGRTTRPISTSSSVTSRPARRPSLPPATRSRRTRRCRPTGATSRSSRSPTTSTPTTRTERPTCSSATCRPASWSWPAGPAARRGRPATTAPTGRCSRPTAGTSRSSRARTTWPTARSRR